MFLNERLKRKEVISMTRIYRVECFTVKQTSFTKIEFNVEVKEYPDITEQLYDCMSRDDYKEPYFIYGL